MACEMIFNFENCDRFRLCIRRSWGNTAYLSHRYYVNAVLMYLMVGAAKFFTRKFNIK